MNYAYVQTKELRAWCDKHNLESFTWSEIKPSKIIESPGQLHRLAVRGYIKRLGEVQIGKRACDRQVEYTFMQSRELHK